jgi:hypothetical protein
MVFLPPGLVVGLVCHILPDRTARRKFEIARETIKLSRRASRIALHGAGANARKSIGITVFSGMLASTCLAVLFVPAFFVVVQSFENRRREKKAAAAQTAVQTKS